MELRKLFIGMGLAGILTLSSCDVVQEVPPPSTFKDITGDGRPDMVFCAHGSTEIRNTWFDRITGHRKFSYRIYFRENLGNGKFSNPRMISEEETKPKDIPLLLEVEYWDDLPIEYKK